MDLPVIGITGYSARASWGAWDTDAVLLPRPYVDAVARAGATPVVLPPVPAVVVGALPRLDGLILSGGRTSSPAATARPRGSTPSRPTRTGTSPRSAC